VAQISVAPFIAQNLFKRCLILCKQAFVLLLTKPFASPVTVSTFYPLQQPLVSQQSGCLVSSAPAAGKKETHYKCVGDIYEFVDGSLLCT
jgi:hypothetical protein